MFLQWQKLLSRHKSSQPSADCFFNYVKGIEMTNKISMNVNAILTFESMNNFAETQEIFDNDANSAEENRSGSFE